MSLLRTPWFTTVELFIPANASNYVNFVDQPQLTTLIDQEVKIMGIELFTPETLSTAPSGATMAPLAELQKMLLTLVNDDMQRIYQYPILGLNRVLSNGAGAETPSVFDLQLFDRLTKIAWTKSKVEFVAAPAGNPYSVVFGIHYDKLSGESVK